MGSIQRQLVLVLIAVWSLAGALPAAWAQTENPVYVDDSPRARELFQRARDQIADNEGEAVRIFQELLDDYPRKLIPRSEHDRSHLVAVRPRVLAELRANESLLDRYQLMQRAEAQRLLESGSLVQLALSRSLNDAGLEALLRLAQDHLESGRFNLARRRLEEGRDHPSLAGHRAVQCWYMLGLASHYLGDVARRDECAAVLEDLGGEAPESLATLRELIDEGDGPDVPLGVTALDTGEASDLLDLVSQTIWTVELEDTLMNRRFRQPANPATTPTQTFDRHRRDGDMLTVAATVAGSAIFVNEGHTVRALDRFTGREIWPRPFTDGSRPTFSDREGDATCDMNMIAVRGYDLVTLTGHAHATTRSSNGKVICLDARTGRRRWATSLDRIGDVEEYTGLFPHGAPIIFEGSVYVLARKLTRQSLTGSYVVSLDLADGSLRWIRHIASSGGRSRAGRAFSTLTQYDGDLFVASAVGAIACVETSIGAIRWLRRFTVPVRPRDRIHRPWEFGGPVFASGRLIAMTPDQRRVVAIDRTTGDELQTADARTPARWNAPDYLVAVDDLVFGIGSEIRAFHGEDITQPLWQFPAPQTSEVDLGATPTPPSPTTITGRVQGVRGALVVPTRREVLLIDTGTGAVVHELDVAMPGNPLAAGSQMLLTTADELEVYMSLDRAEQILRQRLVENPSFPDPGLSLLRLAVRVEDLDLAIEAAQLTLDATDALEDERVASAARDELMTLLVDLHERDLAAPPANDVLYRMIDKVARTPQHRVEYLLAYATWLDSRDAVEAVETLHRITGDAALAPAPRHQDGVLRPAGVVASERIASLLHHHGPEIYDAAARRAAREHDRARERGAEALLAVAHAYPFADAALDAAGEAAEQYRAAGDVRAATDALISTYRLSPDADRAARLLGRAAALLIDEGRVTEANELLTAIRGRHGDVDLDTPDGPRHLVAWQRELSPRRPAPRPRLGTREGDVRALDGRLVPRRDDAGPARADGVLLLEADALVRRTAPDLEVAWSVPLDEASVEIVAESERELLVWVRSDRAGDPRVLSLEPATGQIRWSTPPLRDLIVEPLMQDRGVFGQRPDNRPFDPRETFVTVASDTIYLVQRTGGVVAVDREVGTPVWSRDRSLEQVHLAEKGPFGLVLVGMHREVSDGVAGALTPRVLVLDGLTGADVHRTRPATRSGIQWTRSDAFGAIYCASAEGIEAIDVIGGRRLWAAIAPELRDSLEGWSDGRQLYVKTRGGNLLGVDTGSGDMVTPFRSFVHGDWDPQSLSRLYVEDDRITALFSKRVIRYRPDGEIVGADVIDDVRDYWRLLRADGRLVVISLHDSRQEAIPGRTDRPTVWTYRIYTLAEDCRIEEEPIELKRLARRLETAGIMDGWLLLSSSARTYAIPMPIE